MARTPRQYTPAELNFLRSVAERIRQVRQAAQISQEELADRASLSRSHVSKIESPPYDLQLTTLWRLAEALKVPVSDLLGPSAAADP